MERNRIFKMLNYVLLIFLVVQPIFDIYMAVVGESLDIFGISIVTLIRTITVTAMVVILAIYQIKTKYKTKWLYILLSYIALVVVYMAIHHFNIVVSGGYYVSQGIYNILTEIMYVLRLVVPIILIYIVLVIKPEKRKIEKCMVIAAAIVSAIILLTNLLEVSFASYATFKTDSKIIEYNVIDWFFSQEIPYKLALSKGYFVSANQIGALLVLLLPVVMYVLLRDNKISTYLIFIVQIISMVLIGTRVASYGFMIVSILMLIAHILVNIIKKEKINLLQIIIIAIIIEIGVGLYLISPAQNRDDLSKLEGLYIDESISLEDKEYMELDEFNNILNDEKLLKEYIKDEEYNTDSDIKTVAICKYISDNHALHSITEKYIRNIYPYNEDPEFWFELFNKPASVKGDNRAKQSIIIKRIKEKNNNFALDTIVGMGATPMNSREYMIENDLISHYYNLGIIGIILFVAPYLVSMLYVLIKCIRKIKNLFDLRIITYMLSVIMTFAVGLCAGHVIDEYIITIYLAVISGALFNIKSKEGDVNEKS